MANVLPEKVKLGIRQESTFGSYPNFAANAPILLPVESPEINEEIERVVDENVRGVLGRDFESYAGMRSVTGTLRGNVFLTGGNAVGASPFAQVLKSFLGGAEATNGGNVASNIIIHNFYAEESPQSVSLLVEDDITNASTNTVPVYEGVMFPRLTISFDANEGLVTWETEVLGVKQRYIGSNSNANYGGIADDLTQEAMMGWHCSLGYGTVDGANNNIAPVTGKVLSAEIVMEREIELKIGAANQNWANIRAARPPRVTFSAVLELQTYSDLQKYSNHAGGSTTPTYFPDNQEAWVFRFSNQNGITTSNKDVGTEANGALTGNDSGGSTESPVVSTNNAVFDIVLHTVDYGEGAMTVSRDELANTIEVNGRALYTNSPTWMGAAPSSAAAKAGSKVVQTRVINYRGAKAASAPVAY